MKLLEFDPSKLDTTSTIAVLGKRHSGKSVIIRDLCYQLWKNGGKGGQKIDAITVFSNTEELQSQFARFVPSAFIHNRFDESKLIRLLDAQKQLVQQQGRTSNVMVILDDCSFSKSTFGETLQRIFSNGRHYKLCLVLSLQYSMQLPSSCRGNVDVAIALKEPVFANRKRLYESLFGLFRNFREFDKVFNEVTQDYGAMCCVNNGSSSTDIQKNVFWYRANPDSHPQTFRVGRPIYWEWSEKYRNRTQQRAFSDPMKQAPKSIVQIQRPDRRQEANHDTNDRRREERDSDTQITRYRAAGPPLSFIV
jgi:hypothetical protein